MSTSIDLQSCLYVILPYAALCLVQHIGAYVFFGSRLKTFSSKDKSAFYNRVVSTSHAIVMFTMSTYYWLYLNPKMEIGQYLDAYQARCVLVMMGYLLYDTLYELTASKQIMTLGHHVLGGASHLSVLMSYNGGAGFYSMIIFMAEASTPFLNLSWLLQKQSMVKTTIFKICAMVLILTFFVFRVLLSPYMLWHMISFQSSWGDNNQLFWFNFIVVALFALLNYYWFYKLISLAMKK